MRHRPLVPLFLRSLSALALLVALHAPARAEDGMAGTPQAESATREFPEHNFKWTVPAKWEFADPAEADKTAGYVVTAKRVVRAGVEVTGYVLVTDAGGVSVDANLQMVRDNKSKKLTDIDAKIESVDWAGAEQGHVLKILGKAENKAVVSSLVFGGIVSGKYHQLDLRSVNGANHDIESEIAAAARGYHFLAGAKAEEEPAPPAPGAEPPAADPLKMRFAKLGLTWTLPKAPDPTEPPPGGEQKEPSTYTAGFADRGNKDIAPMESGVCAIAVLMKDGAVAMTVRLELPNVTKADMSASDIIRDEDNFDTWKKELFDGAPIPSMDADTHLGNAPASSRTMTGKDKEGKPLWVRWYATTIKKQLYLAQVNSHDRAEVPHREWMKGAIDGLHWDDTKSGVRGPFVAPFPTASDNRGKDEWLDFDKKTTVRTLAMTLVKPASFGSLKFTASSDPYKPWVFAGEARKPGALLFVGIQRYDLNAFQQQKKAPETLIDDFEGEWRNAIDDAKTRPKSDKVNKKTDNFKTGKGWSYDFSGVKEGNPVVEHGWVVKTAGGNIMWLRAQFVGKDAEQLLQADWEALKTSVKFE